VRDGVSLVLNQAPSPGLAGRFRPDPTLMLRGFVEKLSVRGFLDAVELLRRERSGAPLLHHPLRRSAWRSLRARLGR